MIFFYLINMFIACFIAILCYERLKIKFPRKISLGLSALTGVVWPFVGVYRYFTRPKTQKV